MPMTPLNCPNPSLVRACIQARTKLGAYYKLIRDMRVGVGQRYYIYFDLRYRVFVNCLTADMFKRVFCLVVFCFSFLFVYGQQREVEVIDLSADAPRYEKIQFTEVIDLRPNKERIGFVRLGMENKTVSAVLEQELTLELIDLLTVLYPNPTSKDKLILGVKELHVSEVLSDFKEEAVCDLEIVLLQERAGELFIMGEYGVRRKIRGGFNATKKIADLVVSTLTKCITEFDDTKWRTKNGTPINKEALFMSDESLMSFQVKDRKERGVYHSFRDLVEDNIVEGLSYDFKVEEISGTTRYHVYEKGKKTKASIRFCFTSDKGIYLSANRFANGAHFLKAISVGRYLYFEDFFEGTPAWGAALGIAGAMISSAITSGRRGLVLDTQTGAIFILSKEIVSNMLSEHPALLKEFNRSKQKVTDIRAIIEKLNRALEG